MRIIVTFHMLVKHADAQENRDRLLSMLPLCQTPSNAHVRMCVRPLYLSGASIPLGNGQRCFVLKNSGNKHLRINQKLHEI